MSNGFDTLGSLARQVSEALAANDIEKAERIEKEFDARLRQLQQEKGLPDVDLEHEVTYISNGQVFIGSGSTEEDADTVALLQMLEDAPEA